MDRAYNKLKKIRRATFYATTIKSEMIFIEFYENEKNLFVVFIVS